MLKQLVVDSSVAIKWVLPQPNSPQALDILEQHQTGNLRLLAPDLIYAEIGNIVWKLSHFGRLSQDDGLKALQLFQSIKLGITPSQALLETAYQFALTYKRTVYDSLYVVLSQRSKCSLVTDDNKLVNALNLAPISLITLEDWF